MHIAAIHNYRRIYATKGGQTLAVRLDKNGNLIGSHPEYHNAQVSYEEPTAQKIAAAARDLMPGWTITVDH